MKTKLHQSGIPSAVAAALGTVQHVDDNKRIAHGVILHTGKITPRLSLLTALNAAALKWHRHWDAQVTNRTLAFAGS